MTVLVLEGGGMRAAYASGVADALQHAGFEPSAIYGTSAGGALGTWYAAGQADVGAKTWERVGDRRILSYRRALRAPVIDFRFLYHEAYPHDFGMDVERMRRAPYPVFATLTRASDGKACYVDVRRAREPFAVLHATSAIPLVAEAPVMVDGEAYVDGGVADPVPLARAIADGARDVVLVLNRPAGARSPEPRFVVKLVARRFPALAPFVARHHALHEEAIRLGEAPPEGVRVRIVRPSRDTRVSRLSRDLVRIRGALDVGRSDGRAVAAELGLEPLRVK